MHLGDKADRHSRWFRVVVDRRGLNRGIVAMANKTARMAWVLMTRQESYAPV
jgi:transposase